MKILMIDRSSVIDRRILLEAKSLLSKGYEVELVSGGKAADLIDEVQDGIKIKKIKLELLPLSKVTPKTQETQKKVFIFINKNLKRKNAAKLIFGMIYPRKMLDMLSYINMPLRQKNILFIFFALLTGSPRLITQVFSQLKNSQKNMSSSHQDLPFPKMDFWENRVMHYVLSDVSKIDAIHAHDYPSLKVAVNLAHILSVPLIYDSHELYSYQPSIPKQISKVIFSEEKQLVKYCRTIVVVNNEMAKIMEKDFDFHHFVAITNATETPKDFDPNRKYNLIRERLNLPENVKILLFQGGINRIRKIDLLLQGVAQTPSHIHMAFLSDGVEIAEFRELARELGIAERTHFLGIVPWDEVIYWAASADLGIMPYHPSDMNTRISSPNKMYEFIQAGIPMIAHCGLINADKVIKQEGFGVSCVLDKPEDYARAIMEIFDESKGGSLRFKENIIKRRPFYEWHHEAKKLIQLYQSILSTVENPIYR